MPALKLQILKQLQILGLRMDQDARNLLEKLIKDMPDPVDYMRHFLENAYTAIIGVEDLRQIALQNQPASHFNIQQVTEISDFADCPILHVKGTGWKFEPRSEFRYERFCYQQIRLFSYFHEQAMQMPFYFEQALTQQLGFTRAGSRNYQMLFDKLSSISSLTAVMNTDHELYACIAIYKDHGLTDGSIYVRIEVQSNEFTSVSYICDDCACIAVGYMADGVMTVVAISQPIVLPKIDTALTKRKTMMNIPVYADPFVLVIKDVLTHEHYLNYYKLFERLPEPPSHVVLINWNFSTAIADDIQLPKGAARALNSARMLREATPLGVKLILMALPDISAVSSSSFPMQVNSFFKSVVGSDVYLAADPFLLHYGRSNILLSNFQCLQQLQCAAANKFLKLTPVLAEIEPTLDKLPFPQDVNVIESARNTIIEQFLHTIVFYHNVVPMPLPYLRAKAEVQTNFAYNALVIAQTNLQHYSCRFHDKKCIVLGSFADGMYTCLAGCQGTVRGGVFE